MTSSERIWRLIPVPGATRIPARPAAMNPMIQASPEIRPDRAPVIEARAGSSTTARMETPMRVRWNSNQSAAATRTAHPR